MSRLAAVQVDQGRQLKANNMYNNTVHRKGRLVSLPSLCNAMLLWLRDRVTVTCHSLPLQQVQPALIYIAVQEGIAMLQIP
jgi:hypothetical protein